MGMCRHKRAIMPYCLRCDMLWRPKSGKFEGVPGQSAGRKFREYGTSRLETPARSGGPGTHGGAPLVAIGTDAAPLPSFRRFQCPPLSWG